MAIKYLAQFPHLQLLMGMEPKEWGFTSDTDVRKWNIGMAKIEALLMELGPHQDAIAMNTFFASVRDFKLAKPNGQRDDWHYDGSGNSWRKSSKGLLRA